MNRVAEICKLWVTWNAIKALSPSGGTRMKGSAHPKGDHSPGVCRAVRKTYRPRRPGRPVVKYAA
jgi:hypothetical protein